MNNGHVVEASLGYFINPLVTIAMGVLLLGERLRPVQWTAVATGFAAVLVLAIGYGQPPWISLVLAFSFATYGLVKKKVNMGGLESLAAETAVLFVPALGFLVWLGASGDATFLAGGAGHGALLAATGVVTAIPLVCFGAAAIRVPLSTLGLLQYLAPVFQFAARHPVLPRGDAARAVGRVRAGLGGADAADLGRAADGPAGSAGTQGGGGRPRPRSAGGGDRGGRTPLTTARRTGPSAAHRCEPWRAAGRVSATRIRVPMTQTPAYDASAPVPVHWKLVIDCADPHAQADFWAAALGYTVEDNSALIERLLGLGAVPAERP